MANAKRGAAGEVALLGVRHHGPGSARAVGAALAHFRPDAVLVEGPPEADALLGLAADPAMRPPVALLAHVADDPSRAGFWPYASFSPEWAAIRHGAAAGVPVRFIDLPAAHTFPLEAEERGRAALEPGDGTAPSAEQDEEAERADPIARLAAAAGYDDPERWWDDAVEHRGADAGDPLAPFRALAEAMGELRRGEEPPEVLGAEGTPGPSGSAAEAPAPPDPGAARARHEARREAHMRTCIRAARREGHARIAVVCGAWHVPALDVAAAPPVSHDNALLKGLPKEKVEVTWVPWTHRRLSRASGYGAGIASPGWYHHLYTAPDRPVVRWLTRVAELLRGEDHPVSSAHVIEAVRLAETLAVMRGRPLPGLSETLEAVRAVMCDGSDVALALVEDRLVVGDALGEVPEAAPAVPLQRDLTAAQKSLRLKPQALAKDHELDLRKELDAARSRLLHRLRLLGVAWGEPQADHRGARGTFRETWRLEWTPELAVRIVEAGIWGTTVEAAATAKAQDAAASAGSLAELTALAESCLLAGLGEALTTVMQVLSDRAALDADVEHLAEALPALVRAFRYGDVRGTSAGALRTVAEGLAVRVCIGLPPACAGLDEEAAARLRPRLDAVHAAIGLLTSPDDGPADPAPDTLPPLRAEWRRTLAAVARREADTPGLLRGRAVRLLLDDGAETAEAAGAQLSRALSPAAPPLAAASWLEGFLSGGGMLLVHDERLLDLVDGWLSAVPGERFTDVLPVVRRTFSEFEAGVRRSVAERIRSGAAAGSGPAPGAARPGFDPAPDTAAADAVRPTVNLLLTGRK